LANACHVARLSAQFCAERRMQGDLKQKKKALGLRLRAFPDVDSTHLVGGAGFEPATPAV